MKKKLLRWCLAALIFSLLLLGCRNEDLTGQYMNSKREETFFETKLKDLSQEQQQILIFLQNENARTKFVSKLKDQTGIPVWDKMIIRTNEDIENLGKANTEEETLLIIPVSKDEDELSSVIYAKKLNGTFQFNNITNEALRNFVFDTSISTEIREEVLVSYLFADHHVYGTQHFARLPNDLLPKFIKNGRLSMKSINTGGKTGPVHTDGSQDPSHFVVPVWECLELRDVDKCGCQTLICDMCPACVSSYCSIIWISGGGSGEGTGNPGGDTGGDTGGGTGGSTDCSTGGWYKIIPNGCDDGDNPEPDSTSPCEKINSQKNDVTYKTKVSFLKSKTSESSEYGFRVGNPVPGSGQTTTQYQQLSNFPGTPFISFSIFNNTFGMMHRHFEGLIPIFSPDDINNFVKMLKNANSKGIPLDTVYMTLVNPDGTVYQLWGTNEMNPNSMTIIEQNVIDKELNRIYSEDYRLGTRDQPVEYYQTNFLKFMRDKMNVPGAKFYSMNSSGNGTEVYLNGNERKISNCP